MAARSRRPFAVTALAEDVTPLDLAVALRNHSRNESVTAVAWASYVDQMGLVTSLLGAEPAAVRGDFGAWSARQRRGPDRGGLPV